MSDLTWIDFVLGISEKIEFRNMENSDFLASQQDYYIL